jgi:hypothetical protein
MPHLCQAALGDLHLKMGLEDIDHLFRGGADTVMEEGGKRDGLVAQRAGGHGVGDLGLDLLLAARAPIAVEGMLGGLDLQVGGYVFNDACASATGASEISAAVGAVRQLMFDVMIDVLRFGSSVAGMAGSSAGFATSFGGRRQFLEGRDGARGSVRGSFASCEGALKTSQ